MTLPLDYRVDETASFMTPFPQNEGLEAKKIRVESRVESSRVTD
jgi:hypothetical protein